MSARTLGYLIALISFAVDQASKLGMLYGFEIEAVMRREGPVSVAPFLDLVLVWNRGISYGLLQQDSELGRYLLIGLAVVASILLSVWLWRLTDRLTALGLGLILGGALGNGLDRILHGAVVDLFHFHWGTFSWYVFNLADVWIVVGAAFLVYESFFGSKDTADKSGRNDAANQ
ncbi:signal peptidase II [Cohaesibacter celericrescens]|uniref:signal peptidase II n=1 Tax=Cohaesibacter celericrescens TaxID=2067669 RepID=UPI001FE0B1A2|nr:signal peptidase II [Cohaesibacter celericrescens]